MGKVSKKWCKFSLGLRDPGTVDPDLRLSRDIQRKAVKLRREGEKFQKSKNSAKYIRNKIPSSHTMEIRQNKM